MYKFVSYDSMFLTQIVLKSKTNTARLTKASGLDVNIVLGAIH